MYVIAYETFSIIYEILLKGHLILRDLFQISHMRNWSWELLLEKIGCLVWHGEKNHEIQKMELNYKAPFFINIYSISIKIIQTIARIPCISQASITMVVSFFHLYSNKWWNGATAKSFFLNTFFQKIWRKLEKNSTIKNAKIIRNGIRIQNLMLSR